MVSAPLLWIMVQLVNIQVYYISSLDIDTGYRLIFCHAGAGSNRNRWFNPQSLVEAELYIILHTMIHPFESKL